MNVKLVESIRLNLVDKTSDELLKIWKANDKEQWSAEAFEAIKQILTERRLELPSQSATKPVAVVSIPQRSNRRKIARGATGIVILLWGIEISLYTSELLIVRHQPVSSLINPFIMSSIIALAATCLWYTWLGIKELRGPFALTLGMICAILCSGGLGQIGAMVIAVATKHQPVDDLPYFFGEILSPVALGVLAWLLSFKPPTRKTISLENEKEQ
jgi:hypothetical protein